MAYLNISNPTFQEHVFIFRAPEQRHNQRHDIPSGQTVCVYAGPETECRAIISQHECYGIRKYTEALNKRSTTAPGLLYSIDSVAAREIDPEDLGQIRTEAGETLDDIAARERQLQAAGAASANIRERKAETSLEVSVTREPDANHRTKKDIQKVQVSRNAK